MKLATPVNIDAPEAPFSLSDRIVLMGSCFADNIGSKLADAGFNVLTNPFGTLFNPESILAAVRRLDSETPFVEADCVEMGAGAGRICSFEHHTSFARSTAEEFLENANQALISAREFWCQANRVVISLGTAMVWYHDGTAVANCLKRPASEFTRSMLSINQISDALNNIISAHPEKRFTLTVSPVRHLGDGAHVNALSKASLLLAASFATSAVASNVEYFPAYEIMTDELRDYRFYAEDLVHPSPVAIQYIWERFMEACVNPAEIEVIKANGKAARIASHRPLAVR